MALGSLTPIAPSTASNTAMRVPVRVLWVDVFEARAGDRFAMAVGAVVADQRKATL